MKYLTFTIVLAFLSLIGLSQNGTIKGRIFNEVNNQPIPFANVIIQGTQIGATTNFDGQFEINQVQPGFKKIEVSVVGFQRKVSPDILVTNAKTAYIEIGLQENATQLKEVVIKAEPFSKREEAPVSMRTIGLAEIERNPGGNRDISSVIQSFPGVASSASFRNDIIIRGGAPNENRFYLDGIEVPNINHFATQGASGGPVGMINVNLISEVELYSGAFPANRGNALSSVMEFYQVDGNKEKLRFRGTVGSSDLGITLDGPLSNKISYIVSVRRSYLQFLFTALELPFLPTYTDYQLKVKYKISDKNEISLVRLGAFDEFELNKKANQTPFQRYILGNIAANEQWNYTMGVVYKHYAENSFQTIVVSRNSLNNRAFKYENNDETKPENLILDYNSRETENKLRFENTTRLNGFKINIGLNTESALYTNSTYNRIAIAATPFSPARIDTIDFSSELNLVKYGIFGQVSKKFIGNRLTLSAGFRADGNNYNNQMANLFNQFSPRFSASFDLSEKWSLNFNTGRYFQLPAYTVLGYRENNVLLNKNNGVTYIKSDHIVGGIEFRPNISSRITVEGFNKLYANYPTSTTTGISLANLGADFGVIGNESITSTSKGRAYGLEFLYQRKITKGFYGIFAYTLVRSEFKNGNGPYIPSSWDSEHLVSLTAGKKFKNNWELGFRWRYVHGRPYTGLLIEQSSLRQNWDIRGAAIPDYSTLNAYRLEPFHQLDLRIDKVFYLEKTSLNLYFDVQNAYNYQANSAPVLYLVDDANNQPIIENPNAPYSKQKYKTQLINGTDGTLLPSIGIILDF